MTRLRRLTVAQRVVLVVALAAVLRLIGLYIVSDGLSGPRGGWFGYAPNTGALLLEGGRISAAASLFVWIALVLLWAIASVWLLGPGPSRDAEVHDS